MRFAIAFAESTAAIAERHLLRDDGQEDLAFAIWYPSVGAARTTALIHHVLLPERGERRVHGNASFLPEYFQRAIRSALRSRGGIALMHSHPAGSAWQGVGEETDDDFIAEAGHAGAASTVGHPLVGLTLAGKTRAWSARFWQRAGARKYMPAECESVRVAGDALRMSFGPSLPVPPPKEELRRTVSMWGEKLQGVFGRLRVGVVGAGSVGSLVAETLARMGVGRLSVIDFDRVERHNLDRLLHAHEEHIGKLKVDVLKPELQKSGTASGFEVNVVAKSLVDAPAYRAALDCDVLFSCVDRPWPKRILNHLAYAHLIPVIDGGIAIMVAGGKLKHADWSVHTSGPGRACLECVGGYDPALVSAEMEGYLDLPAYIEGLPESHHLRRNENVFPLSMSLAAHEVLQFVALVTGMKGMHNVGEQRYHYFPGTMDANRKTKCLPGCPHAALAGTGDSKSPSTARV